jgi:hypothetical protein
MPFKKFVESKKVLFQENKKLLKGVFKDKRTGNIVKRDDFQANVLFKGDAKKTYKLYLEWNNTCFGESREFVSAEWG